MHYFVRFYSFMYDNENFQGMPHDFDGGPTPEFRCEKIYLYGSDLGAHFGNQRYPYLNVDRQQKLPDRPHSGHRRH